jgi:sorbitol-specific phosphotransferase system component IIC
MENIVKQHKRRRSYKIITCLDLLFKEFELAYNLGPVIPDKQKTSFKRQFLTLLDPLPSFVELPQEFSFKIESLLPVEA